MRFRYAILTLILILLSVSVLLAQDECPALVQRALEEVGNNCTQLERNSACYGFNRVDASFTVEVDDTFFSHVADRSELTTLQTIRTAPLVVDNDQWGIAVMSVRANVPDTLPGQAVTFILLGDVSVDNTIPADEAFVPVAPIEVAAAVQSNLRSGPSTSHNVIVSVPPGTAFQADALDSSREWLRIIHNNSVMWISRQLVTTSGDIDSLSVLTSRQQTPMQAFYFSTGVGEPTCNEPPSSLVIQGPRKTEVTFNANGTDFKIGSTIILKQDTPNVIRLITVDGFAEVGGIIVPGGFTIEASLDDSGNIIPGTWTRFRALTPAEIAMYSGLEQLSFDDGTETNYLNYPIRFPSFADIMALQQAMSSSGGSSGGGQALTDNPNIDCSGFMQISPIGGGAPNISVYSWTSVAGATRYAVKFYNSSGGLADTLYTNGAETSIQANLGGMGVGGEFQWEVQALLGNEPVCTTGWSPRLVAGAPPQSNPTDGGTSQLVASKTCSGLYNETATVTWSGAPDGDTVTVTAHDLYGLPMTQSQTSKSGSITMTEPTMYYPLTNISIKTSSGQYLFLGSC